MTKTKVKSKDTLTVTEIVAGNLYRYSYDSNTSVILLALQFDRPYGTLYLGRFAVIAVEKDNDNTCHDTIGRVWPCIWQQLISTGRLTPFNGTIELLSTNDNRPS